MLTDDEFERQFTDGSLAEFPHVSHVRLAVIYLGRHEFPEALARMSDGILRFATRKGATAKFHVTVTRAWLELVAAARRCHPTAADAEALMAACPMLRDPQALLRFYSRDRLESAEARVGWVPPDRPIEVDRQ